MASISLCMIVKNEEQVLGRCLDCVKGIADEIIIVDTGSEDQTKEVAAAYTDRIYDFQWNDDFSAARNYAFSKAEMEYSMWLDADDVIREEEQRKIRELKEKLTPDISAVMMKYVTAFDDSGKPAFLFDRERLLRTEKGYRFAGRVHEAVELAGAKLLYSDAVIEHHSVKKTYTDRNLKIYEKMIEQGDILEPRHQFYYGRELYYHGHNEEAVRVFQAFIAKEGKRAWVENLADACRFCARCLFLLGREEEALHSLFQTFLYGVPRPQVCCEIGNYFQEKRKLSEAEYWYRQAMMIPYKPLPGAFIEPDYQQFIPAIQLAVCLDRQGRKEEAKQFNELAAVYKPDSEAVKWNRKYFE